MMIGRLNNNTAESSVPEPSPFEVEIATEISIRYKSSFIHQILSEFVQELDITLRCEIHKCINFIWNRGRTTRALEGMYYCI
jgi:hypothetical protein